MILFYDFFVATAIKAHSPEVDIVAEHEFLELSL